MEGLSLREIQLAELEILTEFDRICRENNLTYSLAGGTMLGAVRHKGFIPWDDDIDVCMPRPDYEKFKEIFAQSVRADYLVLTNDRGRDAEYPFIKILDKRYKVAEKSFKEVGYIWIDIFPVDGFPNDIKKSEKILKKSSLYRYVIITNKYRSVSGYHGRHSKIKFFAARVFSKMFGEKRAIKKSVNFARRYGYENSDFAGIIVWGCYGIGERVPKSGFENVTEMEFEGRSFCAMSCWDEYLKGIYGDYMQLPPEDKRVTHSVQVFRAE